MYDITLSISYHYDSPAAVSHNMLRILPRTLPGQQLITGLITADPRPSFRRDSLDFFGNVITEIGYDMPVKDVFFRFAGRVRRNVEASNLDLSPQVGKLASDLSAAATLDSISPHHFTGPSDRIHLHPEIAAFARQQASSSMSVVSAVQAISQAIHRELIFDPEATEVATLPIEAFRARRGVCQDFTHIMITALRSLGIPAGYVSGFLRTIPPTGQERLEGADAMHAWVQAWCGMEMGWMQIDPTNNIVVGGDHIVVALGRDYSDVAPIKGAIRTVGKHETEHEVNVIPL